MSSAYKGVKNPFNIINQQLFGHDIEDDLTKLQIRVLRLQEIGFNVKGVFPYKNSIVVWFLK